MLADNKTLGVKPMQKHVPHHGQVNEISACFFDTTLGLENQPVSNGKSE